MARAAAGSKLEPRLACIVPGEGHLLLEKADLEILGSEEGGLVVGLVCLRGTYTGFWGVVSSPPSHRRKIGSAWRRGG